MFLILHDVVLVKGTHFQMHRWDTFSVAHATFVLSWFTT